MSGLNEKSRDPSMEDVLASIRKIIAEELDAAHHAAIEDIGPLDHNLPWSERQPNKQAKKSPPVLPVQAVSERPSRKKQDTTSETIEVNLGSVQNGVMTITDTDVSEEQRAAVAEFEQVVTALPVHEIHDNAQETVVVDHESSDLPQARLSPESDHSEEKALPEPSAPAEHSVDPITLSVSGHDWQSAPLPFDVLKFGTETPNIEESGADHEAATPSHNEKSLSDAEALALAGTNPYSDFLDAQKPQLNVKLDLSFLDQTFMDRGLSDKQPEAQRHYEEPPLAASSVVTEPAAHVSNFSIFGQERAPSPLPPFIPANEPSYAPLVSQRTTDALLSSLRHLTEATRPQPPVETSKETPLAPRLDVFMADVLRPLLSQWLDANLERIVDQAVRDEIAKVAQKIRP